MEIKLRAFEEGGKRFIEGHASIFNRQSKILREGGKTFREIIMTGAFDEVLNRDGLNVIANIDHNMDKMLGRTKSNTLELKIDSRGLHYKIEVPNTQLGNDTYELVERGDYYESSFAYGALGKNVTWGRDRSDGMLLRYVHNVDLLKDIAIVRNGAYSETNVAVRSIDLDYIDEMQRNIQVIDCEFGLCQRLSSDTDIEFERAAKDDEDKDKSKDDKSKDDKPKDKSKDDKSKDDKSKDDKPKDDKSKDDKPKDDKSKGDKSKGDKSKDDKSEDEDEDDKSKDDKSKDEDDKSKGGARSATDDLNWEDERKRIFTDIKSFIK